MADFLNYSKKLIVDLIHLHHAVERLCKVVCKDYSDILQQDKAYEILNQNLQEVDSEENRDSVVKKLTI
jgi:hypothetical protein